MTNYFKIFDLPEQFEINLDLLEQKYHDFLQEYHPDKNFDKNDFEKLQFSMTINEGYKVLNQDLTRAIHLLQLKNIDLDSDENNPIKPDYSTLSLILELQEEVAEINNLEMAKILKKQLEEKINNQILKFDDLFKNGDYILASQAIIFAKYLKKTWQDLKNKERNLQ
jgi:molecular chaperone HscB